MTQREIEQAVESIWTLFRETDRRLDQRFEETRQEIAALSAEMRATDQRLDQRFKETDRRLDQRIAETDRRFEETRQEIATLANETRQEIATLANETQQEITALTKQIRATEGLLTGQWGRLLEALVKPGVAELFQARGVPVNRSQERLRVRQGGEEMEIDLLLVNGDALVVVEVKSTLQVEDVRKLLDDLKRFPDFIPEYRSYRRFGAVAALSINESADRYAYRRGLFVLTLGREGLVTLRNDATFRPQDFAAADREKFSDE